jgi:putative FmdB family regulatory protein
MPIYEYRCPDCGYEFERIQSFKDDPITDCPTCESDRVKKKISLSAFSLKGSGWYKDHYGLKSSSASDGASGGASGGGSGDGGGSDGGSSGSDSGTSSSSGGSDD